MTVKPPVFYFLIQVRFNRITQMQEHVPAFQELLRREGFADFNEETQTEVSLQQIPNAQPSVQQTLRKRWLFSDMERRTGFVLLDDALVYHTTAYTRFSECMAAMLRVLEKLHQLVALNFVQRIGMRYLDQIVTDGSPSGFAHQLRPGFLGLSENMPGALRHAHSEAVSQINGYTLVLKSFQSPGGLVLPHDLQRLTLTLPHEVIGNSALQLVMDTDCYIEKRFEFDTATIGKQLDIMHKKLLELFKSTLTEKAREQWQLQL